MEKIIIIGGGASGIVASIFAKNPHNEVTILERNADCLKKLLITGNGRCNYLNERYSTSNYHSKNIDLVDKIISSKNIEKVKDFFDRLGIVPKIKNGYYYPFSNQALTVKNCLLNEAKILGVNICTNTLVTEIKKETNHFIVATKDQFLTCDKLIISTGSFAYPKTGSDGMGYDFLEKFGHKIIKPLPALVQLESSKKHLKDISGVRTDVILTLYEDNKQIKTEEGELQLTDYGLSGICIFNLSHLITRGLHDNHKEIIKVNFLPFVKTLITPWIDKYMKNQNSKNINEALEGILNAKLVKFILRENNISSHKKYSELTKDEKYNLCKSLRAFEFEITKTKSFENAQICNGGLSLEQINITTMESKLVENLYITGELLDINGDCGGYNLTSCWISGMLAGISAGDNSAKS